MNDLDACDDLIASAVDRSDRLHGFVREDETAHWKLMVSDGSWIDASLDGGLLSISTEVGTLGPTQGSQRLNDLMLQYLGFHPDTSFSIDATGAHRLRQILPAQALEREEFKDLLEHFASRAHAWRGLLCSPDQDVPATASAIHHGLSLAMLRA